MNRAPDEIDLLCVDWAEKTRPLLHLADASDLDGNDAVTALGAAAQAIVQVNPKHTAGVAAALNVLTFELRQIAQLHYLMPEVPVRLKARFAGMTPPAYYVALGTAKEFIRGHMVAAAIDARIPSTSRRGGTITLSRAR